MNAIRLLAIVLIAAGTLGLVYGEFSYSQQEEIARLGSLEFSVKNEKTVTIPVWASIGGIVAGVALLLGGRKD